MERSRFSEAVVIGVALCAAMAILGLLLGRAVVRFKEYERVVTAKGLAEREVPADIAIWPIRFVSADNDLEALYGDVERKTATILDFLKRHGFQDGEITAGAPAVTDKQAVGSYDPAKIQLRYSATQTVTVYTESPDRVREAAKDLLSLGKAGIALSQSGYRQGAQFLFTGLNRIKPDMVEEATRKAREVAEKFARDSDSRLGKIKRARQGQFSITDRDSNNPHIKKVRVVNTIEYYLSD
jgi:hypothetical protein